MLSQKLITICDPDDPVPSGEHMHKCHRCNTAWRHGNDLPDAWLTTAQFDKAHSCPRCGHSETIKYRINENELRQKAADYGIPNPTAFARQMVADLHKAYLAETT